MNFLGLDAAQWQAIGTVVLVGVTAWYAYLTRRTAKAAEEAAESARSSAAAAEQALLLESMPILHVTGVALSGDLLNVNMVSLSAAPAYSVVLTIMQHQRTVASWFQSHLSRERGKSFAINVEAQDAWRPNESYEAELTYYDALGSAYRTVSAKYLNALELSVERKHLAEGDWVRLV